MAPPSMLLGADTSPKKFASTLKGAGANNDRDFYLSAMRIFGFNFDEGCPVLHILLCAGACDSPLRLNSFV